jgi:signal transduction histidine kinase
MAGQRDEEVERLRGEVGRLRGEVVRLSAVVTELERSKGQMVALAAHDMRSPLASIIGYTTLMLDEIGSDSPSLPPEEMLGWILSAGRRLESLVAGMQDQALIEQGRLVLQVAPFDLWETVERVAGWIGPRAEGRLRLEVPAGPVRLVSDEGRVQQLVYGVLEQALKYVAGGEAVAVMVGLGAGEWASLGVTWGRSKEAEAVALRLQQVEQGSGQGQSEARSLGVLLVQSLCGVLGGRIEFERAPEGALRVLLPVRLDIG